MRATRWLALSILTVFAIGLTEVSPVLLGRPAPAAERLEDLMWLALNYGLIGLLAGGILIQLARRGLSQARFALALVWFIAIGIIGGVRVHMVWLEFIPATAPIGWISTLALAVAAAATAPLWASFITRVRGAATMVLVASLGLAAASLLRSPTQPVAPNPIRSAAPTANNVILVVADTLRQDCLGSYGDPEGLTPHLDRMARSGKQLWDARSVSNWTKPAVVSLLTGVYPHKHGASARYAMVPPGLNTIPEWFRIHGYATAGFSTNRAVSKLTGLDRGFDRFWNPRANTAFDASAIGRLGMALEWLPVLGLRRGIAGRSGTEMHRQVFEWVGSRQPFFLYVHYMEPHTPYAPPPGVSDATPSGYRSLDAPSVSGPLPFGTSSRPVAAVSDYRFLYRASVRWLDELIGSLFTTLDERGLLARSTIVVVSDHGEEFLDHGSWAHGHSMQEELVRVVYLWSGPQVDGTRHLAPGPASLLDVFPTLCSLEGLPLPSGLDGMSLDGMFAGDTIRDRDLLIESLEPYRYIALTRGLRKSIWLEYQGRQWQTTFDMARDPAERMPLGPPSEEVLAKLRATDSATAPELQEADREQVDAALRDLGYVH